MSTIWFLVGSIMSRAATHTFDFLWAKLEAMPGNHRAAVVLLKSSRCYEILGKQNDYSVLVSQAWVVKDIELPLHLCVIFD